MKFYSASLILVSFVLAAKKVTVTDTPVVSNKQQCSSDSNNDKLLGTNIMTFEVVMKPLMDPKDWPKVCAADTIKCGDNGAYSKCVNDKWVDQKCPCPEQVCRKTGMFDTCMVVAKQEDVTEEPTEEEGEEA